MQARLSRVRNWPRG